MQFQILSCPNDSYNVDESDESAAQSSDYIRVILNDAVVPLTGVRGCPEDEEGKCPMSTFISSVQDIIADIDFAKECGVRGPRIDYSIETMNGSPAAYLEDES